MSLCLSAVVLLALTNAASAGEVDELTGLEKTNIRIMEVATACWFLAVGCSVGSFLNVVAYRLPLGMRLGSPKSHCPHCKTPLSRRENLPVLGWLLLRGRCRHCSAHISPRYPLVEALVGGFFVTLLFVELLSGGKNLPVRTPNSFAGVVWVIWYTKWDLLGLYFFHCCLLSLLTAVGLIAVDRQRVPWSLVSWGVAVGVVFPTVWATLHPVPVVVPRPEWLAAYEWRYEWTDTVFSVGWKQSIGVSLAGLLDSVAGLAGGLLCGAAVSVAERDARRRHNVCIAFAIVGTYLGWQAAVSVATATALVSLPVKGLSRFNRRLAVPTPVVVAAATLVQLLVWRWLSESNGWPSHQGLPFVAWPNDPIAQLAALLATISVLGLVARCVSSPAASQEDGASPSAESSNEPDNANPASAAAAEPHGPDATGEPTG